MWLKKYLYVLRPALALPRMEQSSDPVPVRFNDLFAAVLLTGKTRQVIDRLLVLKQQGMEAKHGPAIPEINEFLEMEITRLEKLVEGQNKAKCSIEPLNVLFWEMLGEV